MKKTIFILFVFIFSQFSTFAQYSVKVGQENSGSINFNLCNNQYEYSWNATVYTQNDIQSHGLITDIYYESELFGGFGPGSNTFMQNQRIFMKLVTDNEMTSAAFPDTNQMTLVYSGMVEFLNYQLATIHLDVPFNLDADKNLMILYINENGNAQTDQNYFLFYPSQNYYTHNNTVYNQGNGSFPSGSGTYSDNMPVVYLRYASGLDAGISSINNNEIFKLPQQADLICGLHNYMADTITNAGIEWELDGTSQPTINWTGNSYCGQDVSVVLQNNFAFAPGQYVIKANTSNPNSGTDELNTNDTLELTLNVSDNKNIAFQNYSDLSIPFRSNSSYGWSVSIYSKDSINFSGQIHAIAYYVINGNSMPELHQKIFMRTTSDFTNPNTNYPDTNLFTKVFEGTINYTTPGWHVIELDTVFDYNNAENLMILYENHAGISTSNNKYFKTGWVGTDAVYNYDNNSFPTGPGNVSTSNRVPALELFFSIPKDAGITKLANSDMPVFTGNYDFIVDFKNYGLDTLQDVDLKYSIDQNTPSSYHWNGNANPLQEITSLNVGSDNLSYGTHDIKIWTESPNYLPDYVNRNDTLTISLRACSPLSGTYTIGTAPSDFLTIKDAIDTLNNCGVNGAVTFNIKPGIYNSQYMLNEVLGSSITNTITFQSQTGDSTDVVLTTDSTNYLMFLNDADYISFKHLTFRSDSAEKLVVLDTNACNNVFVGNIFTSDTTISTFIFSQTSNTDNHILITGNLFENGNTGINLYQDNLYYNSNLLIENNVFTGQNQKAIQLYNLNEGNIVNNQFTVTNIGIYINGINNININANKLYLENANKGIYVDNCLETTISNNFISGNTTSSYNCGIYTKLSDIVKLFYNTVNLDNAETSVFIDYSNDSVFVYNNIFINHTGQTIKKFSSNYFGNHNCFYTPGTVFGSWEGANNINDFQQWQTMSQNDTNSVFALVHFVSATDLHTQSLSVDNLGTPLPEVTTDIDGEIRDTLTPDIGADEFTSSCNGPLAGNYTIEAGGDYLSFTDAVEALYYCGVADTVTFEVAPGIYNEQIAIDGSNINYTNGVKPITFTSQTSNPDDVVLKYSADTMNNFTVKIKDITHLTIDGITMQALDTTYGRVLTFDNFVDSVSIINNKIIGIDSANVNNQTTCAYLDNLNEDSVMYINFTGNTFINGKIAIYNNNLIHELTLNIDNNNFLSQTKEIIHFYNKTSVITNNYINSKYAGYGIYGVCSNSLLISKNKIILSGNNSSGISIYGTTSIYNNFISITNGNYGIWCNNNTEIFNNTILLENTNYSCIENNGSDTVTILNNCLINNNGESIISNYNNNYSNWNIDYNNMYSNSSYFNFTDLVNTLGGNTHSVSFMPDFVSNTDLHTNSALLYQTGIALPEITEDIDGETRNNPPCIGADEFTTPVFHAGNDTVLCFYDQYFNQEFYTYDIGQGYDSYLWSCGSDSSSIAIDTINSVIGNNQYTVTVTVGANTYSDTVNILYDKPDALTQTDYCYWNAPITITANSGFASYQWSTGDTTQSIVLNSSSLPNVTVTDNYGCKSVESVNVVNAMIYSSYNYPADFNIPDTSICNNQSLLLSANQYAGTDVYDFYSFEWSVGDTTQSIMVDSNSFLPGNYQIITTIYLEANQLCSSTDTINVTVTDCSGINTMDNFDITIYPNPAHDKIIIDGEKPDSYELLSLAGRILQKGIIFSIPKMIDISNFPQGIYALKLSFGNNIVVKKIVIN